MKYFLLLFIPLVMKADLIRGSFSKDVLNPSLPAEIPIPSPVSDPSPENKKIETVFFIFDTSLQKGTLYSVDVAWLFSSNVINFTVSNVTNNLPASVLSLIQPFTG